MDQPLEPIQPPPIVVQEPEPRHRSAWVILFCLLAMIIGVALYGYFKRGATLNDEAVQLEGRLKSGVKIRAMGELFFTADKSAKTSEPAPRWLVAAKGTSRGEARLYAVYQYENGYQVKPSDLALIKSSTEPRDQAFVEVYGAKALTPERARRLVQILGEKPFTYKLAGIHALRKAGWKDAELEAVTRASAVRLLIVLIALGLFALGGGLLWIAYILARAMGKLTPLGHPAGTLTDAGADRFAMRVVQYLVGYVAITVVVGTALIKVLPIEVLDATATGVMVLLVPLLAALPIGGKLIGLWAQGWRRENLGKNVLWGIAGAAANWPVLFIMSLISQSLFRWLPQEAHPITLEVQTDTSILGVLLLTATASICAPIFEETLFRGTFLPALSSRFKNVTASIVITSLVFGMMHPTGPPSWLQLGGIGAVSALLAYQTRSLVPSVVMHALHNLITLVAVMAMN